MPFVIGEADPALVEVLRREAIGRAPGPRADGRIEAAADIRVLPPDYEWRGPLSLAGPHQRRNAAVAHGILMALPAAYRPDGTQMERAFGSARVAGRLDRRGRWLFDVAHNPDGMRSLVAALGRPSRPAGARAGLDPGRQGMAGDAGAAGPCHRSRVSHDCADGGSTRVGHRMASIAGCATRRGPPARAEWTLVPDFREAIESGCRRVREPRS